MLDELRNLIIWFLVNKDAIIYFITGIHYINARDIEEVETWDLKTCRKIFRIFYAFSADGELCLCDGELCPWYL